MQREWRQKTRRKQSRHFLKWLPKKIWVEQETEFAGEFEKFCSAEGIAIYSTVSETKAAFAELTIRSLKNISYRYMEDYGYKYIHRSPEFIATMNSRNNRSIDMKPNHVRNCDFMSTIYSKPLREYRKPKFGIGDRVCISKYDLPFRKGYKPQITQEFFEIVAIATKKPATYTIKDEQEKVIREKFYEKELIRVIWVWIHLQLSSFPAHLHSSFQTTLSVHLQTSCRSKWIWTDNGGSNFRDFLPINVPKRHRGEIYVLRWETLQNNTGLLSLTRTVFLHNWHCGSYEYSHTRKKQRNNHRDTCITIKVSTVTQKVKAYLANKESGLAIFSTDLGHIFGADVGNDLGLLMNEKGPPEPTFAYDFVRTHSLMIYTDIVEYNIVGDTKAPLLRCFPFISKLKSGDIITTGQYMNYQTFSNLQFRRLLKNSFHSIHIDLRDTFGEKIPFVLVGITRLVLMFRKVSDTHLF